MAETEDEEPVNLLAEIMYVLSLTREELIAYDQRREREIWANQSKRRDKLKIVAKEGKRMTQFEPTATTLPEFNPTHDDRVASIKGKVEDLISEVRALESDPRCKSLAITNFEQGAMWAVKSLFVNK